MVVLEARGNHEGSHLETHHCMERHYRARTIDDLRRIGIAEVRGDDELERRPSLCEAVRRATAEAEDAEAEDAEAEEEADDAPRTTEQIVDAADAAIADYERLAAIPDLTDATRALCGQAIGKMRATVASARTSS